MTKRNVRYGSRVKAVSLCLALFAATGLTTSGWAEVSNPEDAVRSFYSVLLGNMRHGPVLGESGRYAKLAPVIDRTFDIRLMTRLAIGPAWETLSPAEQRQLQAAFAHYVTATYADQFASYSGQQLQVTGERPTGSNIIVQTKIVKSNGETTELDYLMRPDQGSWQISDVYLDGTISQLAVHRSEFYSILRREGVDGLVTALNRKTNMLQSVARS